MKPATSLRYFSYDSVFNPWLGGGGAYRDLEVLSRLGPDFGPIRLYVGHFPGARRQVLRGIEFIPLGFGNNEIISRVTYVLSANLRLLFAGRGPVGLSLSIYSPFPAALLHRRRLFAVLHHVIGRDWVRKLGIAGWILCGLEWLHIRVPRRFIVSNDAVAEAVRRRVSGARIFRSANGFDPALLAAGDASASSRPNLLFVGRIDPFMKGLDLLVKAFAAIAPDYPDLELILAGRGDAASEEALKALAREHGLENRVLLRKNISDEEKRALLSQCLFFCSPSRFEGWGIAALEANAAGKAVVVSQADGFRNSIRDGYSGIRVDLSDGKNLPAALKDLLDHPEKRKILGLQAREWARQFTWDAIAEKEKEWLKAGLDWPGS